MASASTVLISWYIKAGCLIPSLSCLQSHFSLSRGKATAEPCGEVAADYSGENCSKSLSIAHFHKIQDSRTLLCRRSVGFCKCSFVFTSAALGGTRGSAFACSFSFPSVYINEVECCSLAENQSPMAFAVWELLFFTNGFCWVFWDQMVTIEIIHDPKQIKEKLGTSSLHIKLNQRWASLISFLLFVFKTNVYSWHFWSVSTSEGFTWAVSSFSQLWLPQDPMNMCFSFRICSTGMEVGKSTCFYHAGETLPFKTFLPKWRWCFHFNSSMIRDFT